MLSQQAVTSAPMSLSLQCSQNPTSLSHHRKWREIRNRSNFPGGVKPLCHSRQICPKKWRQLSPNSQTSISVRRTSAQSWLGTFRSPMQQQHLPVNNSSNPLRSICEALVGFSFCQLRPVVLRVIPFKTSPPTPPSVGNCSTVTKWRRTKMKTTRKRMISRRDCPHLYQKRLQLLCLEIELTGLW